MQNSVLGLLFCAVLFFSCSSENVKENNDAEIMEYLRTNNIDATRTTSGLYIKIEEEGGTEKPTIFDVVSMLYTGYTLDGNVFDESTTPIEFQLNRLILGWQEGIPYFGRGGKGSLYVPAHLGYGDNPRSSDIPANGVIVFDIELLDF